MKTLSEIGKAAKYASGQLAKLGINERNHALGRVADALEKSADYIKIVGV